MRNHKTERVTEVTVQPEKGTQFVLVYYIQTLPTANDGDVYALRVDKISRDGVLLDRQETYALTDTKSEALSMIQAFARGTVPPSVLLEMADEWLMQTAPEHTYRRAG